MWLHSAQCESASGAARHTGVKIPGLFPFLWSAGHSARDNGRRCVTHRPRDSPRLTDPSPLSARWHRIYCFAMSGVRCRPAQPAPVAVRPHRDGVLWRAFQNRRVRGRKHRSSRSTLRWCAMRGVVERGNSWSHSCAGGGPDPRYGGVPSSLAERPNGAGRGCSAVLPPGAPVADRGEV